MRLFLTTFAKVYEYVKLKQDFDRYFEGNWCESRNLHLTFKFLGEVKDPQKVIDALEGIEYPMDKKIEFDNLGFFNGRTKILYCSSSSKELLNLEKEISKRLEFLKFHSKDFIAHVTLLRIKKIKDRNYKEFIASLQNRKIAYTKLKLVLIKSTLTKGGPIYEVIKEF